MTLLDLLGVLTEIGKNYGSAIIGALGAMFAAVYGGKQLSKYMRHRILHLEEKLKETERTLAAKETDNSELSSENAQIQSRCSELEVQLDRLRTAFDGPSPWMRAPFEFPARYHAHMQQSIPIMLLANLKGGVGKTTLAANLVPYFERQHGERVLAIDLDYQGSLSSMLVAESFNRDRSAKAVMGIVGGSSNGAVAIAESRPVRDTIRDSRIIECDDIFADFEMRLLIQWLGGDYSGDLRYNLARVLQSPEIQTGFDRIIIDAPPRITTGFVNALGASTHLVVPFVLDLLSAERVGLFLARVKEMKPLLFPHLDLAAAVGTMKRDATPRLGDTEAEAVREATVGIQRSWGVGNYVLEEALIPRRQDIANAAGQRLAYVDSVAAQVVFDRLGPELFRRTKGSKKHDAQFAANPAA